jgi:hypothetical protein
MPVDDPTRPRHVAWEHDWDVWVRIATTTAEGAPDRPVERQRYSRPCRAHRAFQGLSGRCGPSGPGWARRRRRGLPTADRLAPAAPRLGRAVKQFLTGYARGDHQPWRGAPRDFVDERQGVIGLSRTRRAPAPEPVVELRLAPPVLPAAKDVGFFTRWTLAVDSPQHAHAPAGVKGQEESGPWVLVHYRRRPGERAGPDVRDALVDAKPPRLVAHGDPVSHVPIPPSPPRNGPHTPCVSAGHRKAR